MALVLAQPLPAADWSITEAHLSYGKLDIPTFAGGGDSNHFIYTLQHASGWKYGDNFFFVDFLDAQDPGFQDFDIYGEWYSNFSLGKISGRTVGGGLISDVGLLWGYNWASDADVKKYLPGVRLALDLGGFAFANLDFTAYIDDSEGAGAGGAPREGDSFMINFNFARALHHRRLQFQHRRPHRIHRREGQRIRRQGGAVDPHPAAIPLEPERAPLPGTGVPVLAQQARRRRHRREYGAGPVGMEVLIGRRQDQRRHPG